MQKLRKRIGRILGILAALAAIAAIVEQMKLPARERTWHGKVYGVPYDFRRPTLGRLRQSWWNPDDPTLFTGRTFGVGWAVNIHRLLQIASSRLHRP